MPSVPEEGTEIGKRPGRAEKMRTKHVRVFPYDPEWKEEFHKIRRDLEAHLLACRGWVLAIEHVGSTAVEGLAAKPIIDVDVVIGKGTFPVVQECLEQAGYMHEGNLGIVGREAFRYSGKEHLMAHHLSMCAKRGAGNFPAIWHFGTGFVPIRMTETPTVPVSWKRRAVTRKILTGI